MKGIVGIGCVIAFCAVYFVVFVPLLSMESASLAQAPATATPTPGPTPTPLPRLQNPTATLDCGMPVHGWWNQDFYTDNPSLSKPYTWTLTSDCLLPKIADDSAWLHYANHGGDVADATFIINGDGYTIYGPDDDTTFIFAENDSKVVLKNVTIKDADYDHRCYQYTSSDFPNYPAGVGWWWCDALIYVTDSELDAQGVTITNSRGGPPFEFVDGSKASFKNLILLGNTFISTYPGYAGVVTARGAATEITIDGAEICGNQARHLVSVSQGKATLNGNWIAYGTGANTYMYANKNVDPSDDVSRDTDFQFKSSGATIKLPGSRVFCPLAAELEEDEEERDENGGNNHNGFMERVEVFTCEKLVATNPDILVYATYGLRSGVACQQVAGAGIGIEAVLNLGVIDAVDVWAYVSQGVEVCFQHYGRMLFLDADTAPRTARWIAHAYANGWTCSHISGHGTLVLVAPPAEEADSPSRRAVALGDCQLATTDMLSLRAGPGVGYERLEVIPYQTRLSASASADQWYKVEYAGTSGWVSGEFVLTRGNCD